jgi:hypothetical protein
MANRLIDQWIIDWRCNKTLFCFELIGTASSICASVLVSFWPNVIDLSWVFIFWMIGSVFLATSAWMRATAWPMFLMVTYTIFNAVGLYNTL